VPDTVPIPKNTPIDLPGLNEELIWRPLKYLNFYRLILSVIFVGSFFTIYLPLLGSTNPKLFQVTSLSYLAAALSASFIIHGRWLDYKTLIYSLAFFDIAVLTLLMHSSGGIETGLGMLIVVAIAGNSLILGGRAANLFAAIAVISLLGEQVYVKLHPDINPSFTQAGILGATLFATAYLAHVLSTRIRESEELAKQRGVDLANLAQLNQHVLQRMQSGIIVVDTDNRIRLMNESAWHMLGLPTMGGSSNKSLNTVSPELAKQLSEWLVNKNVEPETFKPSGSNMDLLPKLTALGTEARAGTLIYLEDTAHMAQQAQQMKLASLGQLTASIAHEIRNPLGAISHAEQLLAEANDESPDNKRLLEIIHTNTLRVNNIIENVLQLGRRDRSVPEQITLEDWLKNFSTEFTQSQGCKPDDISISINPPDISIFIDTTHLHQVLWNLCQNGLRYSIDIPDQDRLQINVSVAPNSTKPVLDVIDNGPGIETSIAEHIFEPFFTTDSSGSGLGLYISSELCSCNNAKLSYVDEPNGGSCFRIEFADSPRQQTLDS
jgi:two-component system sensor histidine kinase PilS (NtrC family)